MAHLRAIIKTMLLFVFHVAPSWGQAMDAGDRSALTAVRQAIENKEKFSPVLCDGDVFRCDSYG